MTPRNHNTNRNYQIPLQCCHSEKKKTLDGPIKIKPKKPQGRISLKISVISDFFPEKCNFYPKSPNFSPKNFLLSAKISDDLFSLTSNFKLSPHFRQQHDTFPLNQ